MKQPVRTSDDVVRLLADLLREQRGEVVSDFPLDQEAAYARTTDRKETARAINNAMSMGLVELSAGDKVVLTPEGLDRFAEIDEAGRLGRLERLLRRESKVRGLTWGLVLQLATLGLAVVGALLSVLALLLQ